MHARIYLSQLVLGLKLYLRIPAAMFWMIAFPVVMLMGMGTIFGGSSDANVKLVWSRAGPPSPQDSLLERTLGARGVTLEIVAPSVAEARWQTGRVPALLEGQQGHYALRVNSYNGAQGMQIDAMVQQGYLVAQARAQGEAEPASIPVAMSSPGGHRDGPYAAYLLPGLLGLNLLMMGVFSVGMVDVTLREKGTYRRLATTPLPRHVYLGAQLTVRLIVMVISASTLMLVGAMLFGIHNQGSYFSLFALLMLGSACFISLGYLMASFARNVDVYNGISNLVFLPLMLLSGVYFSLDSAPAWLQHGADLLPLAPLLTALRSTFNDGASLMSQGPDVALIAAWTIVLFVHAARRFRWI